MKAVIIEDEIIAAQALQALITETNQSIETVAILSSIDESVEWFMLNPAPDLVFMDIHLADGSSFKIFDEVEIKCPIIFTTAYDEYALKAFEVNSIAYLLKPICKKDLERALDKYKLMKGAIIDNSEVINKILVNLKQNEQKHKSYFLIPEKDKLIPLSINDIAYIFIDTKVVKAITLNQKTYFLDKTLDEISEQLNPNLFFRANRQYIIARKAVKDLSIWFGSKIAVNLTVPVSERIIVSKVRAKEFKSWMAN
jgi:two-component system LytT family response regulator